MVTFDSPIERCPLCEQYVLMDQTQQECALEHQCQMKEECPLNRYFTGKKYKTDEWGKTESPI